MKPRPLLGSVPANLVKFLLLLSVICVIGILLWTWGGNQSTSSRNESAPANIKKGQVQNVASSPTAPETPTPAEPPEMLTPGQTISFSAVPGNEKVFVLQMKKGDFAELDVTSEQTDCYVSLKAYDSRRTEFLKKTGEVAGSIWFTAPSEGDFLVATKLSKLLAETSADCKLSIRYNNESGLPSDFNLEAETELGGLRKINGYHVRLLTTPTESMVLVTKNDRLKKAIKQADSLPSNAGYEFLNGEDLFSTKLLDETPDKTGDGTPDVVVYKQTCNHAGRNCSTTTYFIDLGPKVRISEFSSAYEISVVRRNPKGGLIFSVTDTTFSYFQNRACSFCERGGGSEVMLTFQRGVLRPNFSLMKQPQPSLADLRSNAEKFRHQLSPRPYKGDGHEPPGLLYSGMIDQDIEDPEDVAPGRQKCTMNGDPNFPECEDPFWYEMIDLIYAGNEASAWQFLDMIWPPHKRGKAIFVRDFKRTLSLSEYWKPQRR